METPRFDALLELCASRHSIREFAERAVPEAVIERLLQVAHTAPYASGRKNWEVMVITDPVLRGRMVDVVRRRAEQIAARVRPGLQGDFATYATHFSAFASAPAILVPTYRVAPSLTLMLPEAEADIVRWERDNFVKSIACVGMLILLAAEAQNLGGCFMTGPLLAEEELLPVIGAKRGRSIAALIPVGYPKESASEC